MNPAYVIAPIIAFFLGLISTTIVEHVKNYIKAISIRRLTLSSCIKDLEVTLPRLKKEYEIINEGLKNYSAGGRKTQIFEDLSSEHYRFFSPEEYYKAFKNDFQTLVEVRNIIDVVKKQLPLEIVTTYFKLVNKDTSKIEGDIQDKIDHAKECDYCKLKLEEALKKIECRMDDIEELEKKLRPFVEKYKELDWMDYD